ncbi:MULTISPECIES: alpha/beta hydrolase fold domain-containing protein [unclassified Bacillus (in: firmicutes)]|uniref:alpha/beta hydrolase n=1 Tax=unclassified Bacillus (in: firmicutes) TaxID=185979 RepID=UPI002570892F|nr:MULTISPECIES: alpha/beta hydrolase fold domain-containing protein [unclassified Bacillus (in: firmicutes)]
MANLVPKAKAYVEMFNQMPTIHKMEPEAVREMFANAPPVEVELAPLAKVENKQIQVGQDESIKIRIYTPEGEGPLPVFVYYHGGGWVIGDSETSDASCRMLANRTKRIVVSVDYRLAPEYKFPIPFEDSFAALNWVSEHESKTQKEVNILLING